MKKLIYNLIMAAGALLLIFGSLLGIFSALGICATIYGEGVLKTALGNPPDPFHPAYWLCLVIGVPGITIGFFGGLPICQLVQSYANWKFKGGPKPSLKGWLANLTRP